MINTNSYKEKKNHNHEDIYDIQLPRRFLTPDNIDVYIIRVRMYVRHFG